MDVGRGEGVGGDYVCARIQKKNDQGGVQLSSSQSVSLDQEYQHHLGTCKKSTFSASTYTCRFRNSGGRPPLSGFIRSLPFDGNTLYSFRTRLRSFKGKGTTLYSQEA